MRQQPISLTWLKHPKSDTLFNNILYILLIFTTACIAFVVVPFNLVASNPGDFDEIGTILALSASSVMIFSVTLFCSLCFFILRSANLTELGKTSAWFGFVYVCLSGLMFPVIDNPKSMDPFSAQDNFLFASILLFVSLALSFLRFTAAKYVLVAFFTVLLTQPIFIAIKTATEFYTSELSVGSKYRHLEQRSFAQLSNDENLLVVSFDGLPGYVFNDIITNSPIFQKEFKDFRIFTQASSCGPATSTSMVCELFGNQDFKSISEKQTDLRESLNFQTLPMNDKLSENQVFGDYGVYSLDPNNILKIKEGVEAVKFDKTVNLFNLSIMRMTTSRGMIFLNSTIQEVVGIFSNTSIPSHLRGHWDMTMSLDINDLKAFIQNLSVSEKMRTQRYMHFAFTHFPIDYNQSCEKLSNDKIIYKSIQNYEGMYDETICAVNLMYDLIVKLKQIDAYSNSTIIFKSDHGKPSYYFDAPPHNLGINGHPDWGFDRYFPALMIKRSGWSRPKLEFNDNLVLLSDLAMSICKVYMVNPSCRSINGVNLFGDKFPTQREFFIYVVSDKNGKFNYDYLKSIKLNLKDSLFDTLKNNSEISLTHQTKRR